MKYSIPPGVFDILPIDEQEKWKSVFLWQFVEKIIRETVADFGYREIRTPLFERTELFQRSVGDTSDIVSKEMYTFQDKGGRSLSLRPEGTAPVMRAIIDHKLDQKSQKLFYIAPMFRYERAQAGRYRQHHQFGAEAVGSPCAQQEVELIDLLFTVYKRIGLKNFSLHLNSIGTKETKLAFRQALVDYLAPKAADLSPDSQNRLHTNPLRILDSKNPNDQQIVSGAPSILHFLSSEERAHFEKVQELLSMLEIPFQINPLLVRGLDYYTKTVFEIVCGDLGAQNSIGGGGRYDNLMSDLGGPSLPSIGFGTGIERIIQTMINQDVSLPSPPRPLIFLVGMGEEGQKASFSLLHELRQQGLSAQMDFGQRKVGKALQYADQIGAKFAAVIGENEIEKGQVSLKEMSSGRLFPVDLVSFVQFLKSEDRHG